MYKYVHICIFIHIYEQICMHIRAYLCTNMYKFENAPNAYLCTHAHIYILQTYLCSINMHLFLCIFRWDLHDLDAYICSIFMHDVCNVSYINMHFLMHISVKWASCARIYLKRLYVQFVFLSNINMYHFWGFSKSQI